MSKAPIVLKTLKPTGKWLTDADLRHDAAIRLGCYTQGVFDPPVNVSFLTSDLREKQKQIGGELVVDKGLTTQLYDGYLNYFVRFGEYNDVIQHIDYPSSIFIVKIHSSKRKMSPGVLIDDISQAYIPGPVKFLTFWRVARSVSVGKNPLKN